MSTMSDLATVFADVDPYPARHAGPNPVILERVNTDAISAYRADSSLAVTFPNGDVINVTSDGQRLTDWLKHVVNGRIEPDKYAVLNDPSRIVDDNRIDPWTCGCGRLNGDTDDHLEGVRSADVCPPCGARR